MSLLLPRLTWTMTASINTLCEHHVEFGDDVFDRLHVLLGRVNQQRIGSFVRDDLLFVQALGCRPESPLC
jgi:hypothetical protein